MSVRVFMAGDILVVRGLVPQVPYVRMTQRGKYVSRRAQAYMASQEAFALKLKVAASRAGVELTLPGERFALAVCFPAGRGDLDNRLKALMDALSGLVWPDDRAVVALSAVCIGQVGAWAVSPVPAGSSPWGCLARVTAVVQEMVHEARES